MQDSFDNLFEELDEQEQDMIFEGEPQPEPEPAPEPPKPAKPKAQPPKAPPAKAQTPAPAKAQPQAVSVQVDLDSFDSLLDSLGGKGVLSGELGTKINRFPIERMRFTTAKRELIAIISNKVLAIKTHYVEDLGSILCFEGACCVDQGMPKVRYVFPAVKYETDAKGRPISKKVEVMAFMVSSDVYEDIIMLSENMGAITDMDLMVSCKDEQYQNISIQPAGRARWKSSAELVQQVTDTMKTHAKHLLASIARPVTPQAYAEALGKDPGVAAMTPADFDSAFGLE